MTEATRMIHSSPRDSDAWYRQFYVWLIIVLPACAITASFATLYVAAIDPPELVVDDYSSIEATVARNIQQDKAAANLALDAQLTFGGLDGVDTRLLLDLQSNRIQALPHRLIMRIVHGTQSAYDVRAELAGFDGRYTGVIRLPTGNYSVVIEDPAGTWRLQGRASGAPASLRLRAPAAVNHNDEVVGDAGRDTP